MDGEILSVDEVERLLSMISWDKPPSQPRFNFTVEDEEHPFVQLDKTVMRTLQTMHDRFARRFTAQISKMLQSVVDIRMTTVQQMYYNEFVFGFDSPSCFNLIEVELLTIIKDLSYGKANIILDISPVIAHPMIERILGGGREPTMTARRPLTNIEWKLTQRIIDEFLYELHVTWKDVANMKYTVAQQESNPQMISIKNNEPVVVLCFEVMLTERRGGMAICIPVDLVRTLIEGE